MRLRILSGIALAVALGAGPGCASHASRVAAPAQSAAASGFPATRWAPSRPTYLVASRTLADAQRSLRDLIDLAGVVLGVDPRDVEHALQGVLGVDALHGDPLAAIGVDVQGGWAMFSEDLSPTMVIHLSSPEAMTAFLDHQRERGLVTQSVIVDKIEVSSAALAGALTVSWAIAGDWMWIHIALPIAFDNGAGWFAESHGAHAASWTDSWAWAQRAAGAAAGVVGYLDLHGALATVVARLPAAAACARVFDPVQHVGFSVSGDDRHIASRIAIDVGSTAWFEDRLLPAPSGWDATAARAPIAAQWNLDLAALSPALAPCLAVAGNPLASAGETGVRAARGVLLGFDPDKTQGSGAVVLDLSNPGFLERQLDRIPLRRAVERSRTFAGHKGAVIEIPFSITVEYVLEPQLAVAALGEGIVSQVLSPGPGAGRSAAAPPVLAVDLVPPAMSPAAWEIVVDALIERRLSGSPSATARRIVERLMQWRAGHLAVAVEASEIVLTASGVRR